MRVVLTIWLVSVALPAAASPVPEACSRETTSVAWTQPPQRAIEDEDAVRWPIDATLRIAYAGRACPSAEQFTLRRADGEPVPARVVVRVPSALAVHAELPTRLIEVDPVAPLEGRTDYTLAWTPDDAQVAHFDELALPFKTFAHPVDPLPIDAFEGILAVEPFVEVCAGEGITLVSPPEDVLPGCTAEGRVRLAVRYRGVNRTDLVHVVERVSSTPLDAEGAPLADEADREVVPIAYERGGDDRFDMEQGVRRTLVVVADRPAPRRDCLRVRLIDAEGVPRGDPEAIACIDLAADLPCALAPGSGDLAARALVDCAPLGIHGADPYGRAPPDAGVDAGAAPETGGAGGCDCRAARTGPPSIAGWLLLLLTAGARRRR